MGKIENVIVDLSICSVFDDMKAEALVENAF